MGFGTSFGKSVFVGILSLGYMNPVPTEVTCSIPDKSGSRRLLVFDIHKEAIVFKLSRPWKLGSDSFMQNPIQLSPTLSSRSRP